MTTSDPLPVCRSCGAAGSGAYCSRCGQAFVLKRISLGALLHDVFHFFTHLDKGFGFTLRQLTTAPGTMQRLYLEGDRARHQKPFSMFFISATVAALSRYWLNLALLRFYGAGDLGEAQFFHQYMVMLHMALLPAYSFIVFLFFRNSRYNYGEIVVLMLYTVSFFFLTVSVVALLKFLWPHLDTAYVELPLLAVYNVLTFLNFFTAERRWVVVLKSIVLMALIYSMAHSLEDVIIKALA